MLRTIFGLSAAAAVASSFRIPTEPLFCVRRHTPSTTGSTWTALRSTPEEAAGSDSDTTGVGDVEGFLSDNFAAFHSLLSKNEDVWKTVEKSSDGCTFFAPNARAFEELGEKKLAQLEDPRNLETAQKMGAYHVVTTEAVTSPRLQTEDWTRGRPKDGSLPKFTVGGIVTLGGEVPVGRGKSGGFMGIGAKEDGGAVVGPNARILKSTNVGDCIVHEMDALISPEILWRYCDQLRIPGF